MPILHTKVSTIASTSDPSLVQPSDWNAAHTISGTLDLSGASSVIFPVLPTSQLPFSATPVFPVTTNASYAMTLTGNVTSSSTSGTPLNGNLLSLTLTEDGVGGHSFVFPANFVFSPGFTFTTTALAINELTFKFDGTNWHLISNGGGAGGGSGPNGNNGDLQLKASGSFGASAINDNGSFITVGRDASFNTNPYMDVRQFGIRAAKSASTTCTTIATSANITIASAQTFINGVGVTCKGAGAATGLSTPSAPTVTAGQLGINPGMGNYGFTPVATGSTTYSYQLVAGAQGGGYTLPSTATTITNGPASLGPQTFTLSGWTAANNVITVTTTASHGLAVGAAVWFVDSNLQGGPFTVATVPTGTTFTFNINSDTRNSFPTSGGAGSTVTYYNAVQISAPITGGVFQWFVYGGSAGAGNLLHPMLPQSNNVNLASDPLNNVLMDLGSSMMTLPSNLPSRIPLTAPGAAVANDLITTISSGGGTTNLTLATTAGTSVSGAAFFEDDTATLVNAANAASNTFMLQVPVGVSITANSVVNTNVTWQIQQAGSVTLNDTLIASRLTWTGSPAIGNTGAGPSFAFQQLPTVFINAYPGVWLGPNNNNGFNFSNLNFQGTQNGNLILVDQGGIPASGFSNVSLTTSGATTDCISRHFTYRNSTAGGTFMRFKDVSDGPGACTATTYAPVIISTDSTGIWDIKNFFGNRRGIYLGGTFQGVIDSIYVQGAIMPDITLGSSRFGTGQTYLAVRNAIQDTSFYPYIQYVANRNGNVLLEGINGIGGGRPAVQGAGGIVATHCRGSKGDGAGFGNQQDTCGPNMDSFFQGFQFILDGLRFTQPTFQAVEYRNAQTLLGPLSTVAAVTASMPAPILSVAAGGTVPLGTHYLQVAPVFPTGNGKFSEGLLSPASNTVTTTTGNQTLTFPITPVTGAVGYDLYDNGFSVQCAPPFVTGAPTTLTWNGSPARCGQSAANAAGGGPTSLTTAALTSPVVTVTSAAGAVSHLTSTATATRAVNFPDAAGSTALVAPGFALATNRVPVANSSGVLIDGVPPMSVFDSFSRPNGTISAGNPNWVTSGGTINISSNTIVATSTPALAVYNGVSFPTDDQTSSITINSGATGSGFAVVRGSASAVTGYLCGNGVGGQIVINKLVSGTNTFLNAGSHFVAAGDTFTIEAVGNTISCYVNGTLYVTVTDNSIPAGGYPGVAFEGAGNNVVMSNFRAAYGAVSLNVAQTWNAIQNFGSGLQLNGSNTLTSASGNSARVAQSSGTLGSGKIASFDANANVIALSGSGTTGFTFPSKGTFIAAGCNAATASPSWDLPTASAPTPNCNTGTNIQEGTLDFADGQSAQFKVPLPSDWTGAIDADMFFFSPSTSGTVIWNIATACSSTSGSAIDDVAFNAANAFPTITLNATANAQWVASTTGITTTGCSAGNVLQVKISRATDTAAGVARAKLVQLTIRRAL